MFKIKDKVKTINELMPLALNSVHTVTTIQDVFIGLDGNTKNLYAAEAFELVPEVDPFAELKQAYAEGKTIELNMTDKGWTVLDPTEGEPCWCCALDSYRIKPEPKQVKEFTRESLKGCYIINDHGELLNKFIKTCNDAGCTNYSKYTLEALYVCCDGKDIMGNDHLYGKYTTQLTLKDFGAEPVKPTSYPKDHFEPTHTGNGCDYHVTEAGKTWFLKHDTWVLSLNDTTWHIGNLVPIKKPAQPHKHAELIKAWADGAEIEFNSINGWVKASTPSWTKSTEYRIKPTEFKTKQIQSSINLLNGVLAKSLKKIVDLETDVVVIQTEITELKEQL